MRNIKEGSIIKLCGVICTVYESLHGHLYIVNENNRKMFLYDSMAQFIQVLKY